ncbi:site-2 protease family protein [bacterium]|nr:site-2 protease family protein [bacterium]
MSNMVESILWIPGLLLALTFHEYAHGKVAYELGDPTAARAGRLTLNPLSHLDPLGTIALFIFHIGWAKPVPINPYYFKNPRRDTVLVSIAGPAVNFILAIISGLILKIMSSMGLYNTPGWRMILYTMDINVILAMFNLIPVPPLDGSKILFGIVKMRDSTMFMLERFGPMILLGLILLGSFTGFNILRLVIYPGMAIFNAIFI